MMMYGGEMQPENADQNDRIQFLIMGFYANLFHENLFLYTGHSCGYFLFIAKPHTNMHGWRAYLHCETITPYLWNTIKDGGTEGPL